MMIYLVIRQLLEGLVLLRHYHNFEIFRASLNSEAALKSLDSQLNRFVVIQIRLLLDFLFEE
ncbi:unnamed protein product [Haemonchus placei]|uniref:Uncharacterized protein n=1 Tax=Haemonchus placei TaxID=6290 RepID=A0A0N4WR60_HAEPC|nr:unnamed protein product [Haemonchus placei]